MAREFFAPRTMTEYWFKSKTVISLLAGLAALAGIPLSGAESTAQDHRAMRGTALMPYPREIELAGESKLRLDKNVRLCFTAPPTPRLRASSARFRAQLRRQTSIVLPAAQLCDSMSAKPAKPALSTSTPALPIPQRIELTVKNIASNNEETTLTALDQERAAYRLQITENGVHLSAEYELGLLHGLQTLSQLIGSEKPPPQTDKPDQVILPALTIVDSPRFRWRGLMLDSARHFFSVETIKRQLDGMAAAKLNVFHWHLTDDQGWRLESRAYPRLHQTAPGGNFYSRAQVREIVHYARERGIAVVPEIDMPGHASAIAHAYPELISAPGPYPPEDGWGVHKPLLNPADPAVYEFAEKVLTEVAELFPFEYVHIGGDEVDPEQWLGNSEIRAYMQQQQLADSHALHSDFNRRLAEILAHHKRKMIGWDEILHPGLDRRAMVQSWRGPDALGDITRAGHYGILSTGFYLDQPQYTAYHYRNTIEPRRTNIEPLQAGESWQTWAFTAARKRGSAISGTFTLIQPGAGEQRGVIAFSGKRVQPLRTLEQIGPYTLFEIDTWMGPLTARLQLSDKQLKGEFLVGNAPYHPSGKLLASSTDEESAPSFSDSTGGITPSSRERVLGGEAALWTEMVTEQNIDIKLWPRAFAVAERLWSGKELQNEEFLYSRLAPVSQWSETAVGLQHRQQQSAALKEHFPTALLPQAHDLTAVLEPAHYYHRHHEKSQNETYSRRDALNRLADTLAAESIALRPLRQLAKQANPIVAHRNHTLQKSLMQLWKSHRAAEVILQSKNRLPAEITAMAKLIRQQADLAFLLVARYLDHAPFTPSEEVAIRNRLQPLKGIHHEMVLPAIPALERLLDRLQHATTQAEAAQQVQEEDHG